MYQNEINLIVRKADFMLVLNILKNHVQYQFKILVCVSGVDYLHDKYRFRVSYELLSIRYNFRLRVKVLTNELMPLESCKKVFPAASWYESEIWDMYGIFFNNHVNLVRLLTDYGFEGHPLRKDFPLKGFVEASYDYARKRVVNERIELGQEFRVFKFSSPWEISEFN